MIDGRRGRFLFASFVSGFREAFITRLARRIVAGFSVRSRRFGFVRFFAELLREDSEDRYRRSSFLKVGV